MTKPLRIVDTGLSPARWNTAVSAALLHSREIDPAADILRFYRFPRSVLLGATQAALQSLNWANCQRENIEVARRITGGGAVYMCPSMLAWDFVTALTGDMDNLCQQIGIAFANSLQRVGIAARFRAPNDLRVDGRKVSGAAMTSLGGSLLHQGTLLLYDEVAPMAAALGASEVSLRAHVASFADCSSVMPEIADIQWAISEELSREFALSPIVSQITPRETQIAEREYVAELSTEAHVHGCDWRFAEGIRG